MTIYIRQGKTELFVIVPKILSTTRKLARLGIEYDRLKHVTHDPTRQTISLDEAIKVLQWRSR